MKEASVSFLNILIMKKSKITLIGVLFFVTLLVLNLIFAVSPGNNEMLVVLIGFFLLVYLLQIRKEKRV